MTGAAPLALTMGDPAGIGAEIALKAWRSGDVRHAFFLLHDPEALAAPASMLKVPLRVVETPEEARIDAAGALAVLPCPLTCAAEPGHPAPENAPAVLEAIERAVVLTRRGAAGAVVTNPINKKALYDGAGFAFPGHTEFLAHLGGVARSVMMLAGPRLRVVPVTIHIPLAEVPGQLDPLAIAETIRITERALRQDFAIPAPRIAVSGLNPHAGEGGAMGREELEIIAPALERLRAEGLDIRGPLPADTMFHDRARAGYDVAITMYHDQGLIPIKALDFDQGVNVTLGLPFIRTSPDHGTAYDIAGRGMADPSSLIAALNLAGDMAATRARAAEAPG